MSHDLAHEAWVIATGFNSDRADELAEQILEFTAKAVINAVAKERTKRRSDWKLDWTPEEKSLVQAVYARFMEGMPSMRVVLEAIREEAGGVEAWRVLCEDEEERHPENGGPFDLEANADHVAGELDHPDQCAECGPHFVDRTILRREDINGA